MNKSLRSFVSRFWQDESGSVSPIVIVVSAFIVAVMLPFVMNTGRFHHARSVVQTSADSAALAAAHTYVQQFNITERGECKQSRNDVAKQTRRRLDNIFRRINAAGVASSYATANHASMSRYNVARVKGVDLGGGISFSQPLITVETTQRNNFEQYGDFTSARAGALVVLDDLIVRTTRCVIKAKDKADKDEKGKRVTITLRWKSRLTD